MENLRWSDLPKEIQEKMLEHQVEQGNPKDEKVFIADLMSDKNNGGFRWFGTIEGGHFWDKIIGMKDIEHFYSLYPKSPKNTRSEIVLSIISLSHGLYDNYDNLLELCKQTDGEVQQTLSNVLNFNKEFLSK